MTGRSFGQENTKTISEEWVLLSPRAKMALIGYKAVSSRHIVARFQGVPLNMAVIQIYAPTADSKDDDIEDFYETLEATLQELPKKDIKLITGDWNAKIGKENINWVGAYNAKVWIWRAK